VAAIIVKTIIKFIKGFTIRTFNFVYITATN